MVNPTTAADVLFVSGDLLLGSRVRSAITSGDWSVDGAANGAGAVERLQSGGPYRLVLVDLQTPGLDINALMAARSGDAPPVIAYGPHVHETRLEAARNAGCERVLTRGQFDATLPQLLTEHLDSTRG